MSLSRSAYSLVLAIGMIAGVVGSASGQDPLPRSPSTEAILAAKNGRGIAKKDLPTAQQNFATFAKFFADTVAHPLVYKAGQDPLLKFDSAGRRIPAIDDVIREIDRFLLVPNPFERTASDNPNPKVNANNADYIREFGKALDDAFQPLIETNPSRIVRVNAMRVYASFCRSGAAAHWPRVTELLTNPNTPTEVKYYALQAAGNLLSAYDVFDYRTRRHALSREPRADADRDIGKLIEVVTSYINDPNTIIAAPEAKQETRDPEREAVIAFIRRQAVRALAQVRFIGLPGSNGEIIYPSATLARVAMSDPKLLPAPSPSECAEAVLGLCNMSPNPNGAPIKGFNPDAVAEAVANGLITFAGPRSDPSDRSLPWRGYSMRISDAFRIWPLLFDPLFDPIQIKRFDASSGPKIINDLVARAQTSLLTPLDKVDASGKPDPASRPDIEGMRAFLKQIRDNPKRSGMIVTGVPQTALPN